MEAANLNTTSSDPITCRRRKSPIRQFNYVTSQPPGGRYRQRENSSSRRHKPANERRHSAALRHSPLVDHTPPHAQACSRLTPVTSELSPQSLSATLSFQLTARRTASDTRRCTCERLSAHIERESTGHPRSRRRNSTIVTTCRIFISGKLEVESPAYPMYSGKWVLGQALSLKKMARGP